MAEVVSVTDLLAAPERFEAKTVTVVGFYVGERENHAVYPSDAEAKASSRGVWLSHEATVGGQAAVARLNRGWVRIVGMFHNRRRVGAGHFNAYAAYLSGITEFEAAEPLVGETKMDFDTDKVDEAVLALLHLTRCDDKFGASAWRSHDWDALNRLHAKGYIGDPVNKNKSVALTEEGRVKAEELFRKLFGKSK